MTRPSADETGYKKKAAENFAAATLLQHKHPNASASRAYYAVSLGAVGEYEKLGVKPELIDRGAADALRQTGIKWTHSFVKNNGSMLGLDARQCGALRSAYKLRCLADYRPDPLLDGQLELVLELVEDILECLGVNVKGA